MFQILQQPKISVGSGIKAVDSSLENGARKGAEALRNALADASPGGLAKTWSVKPWPQDGPIALAAVNSHPAAKALDKGAVWKGKMPPWGPNTPLAAWATAHGRVPYLVARKLKREGMQARHFTDKAMAQVQSQVVQIVRREGVGEWLRKISRA